MRLRLSDVAGSVLISKKTVVMSRGFFVSLSPLTRWNTLVISGCGERIGEGTILR